MVCSCNQCPTGNSTSETLQRQVWHHNIQGWGTFTAATQQTAHPGTRSRIPHHLWFGAISWKSQHSRVPLTYTGQDPVHFPEFPTSILLARSQWNNSINWPKPALTHTAPCLHLKSSNANLGMLRNRWRHQGAAGHWPVPIPLKAPTLGDRAQELSSRKEQGKWPPRRTQAFCVFSCGSITELCMCLVEIPKGTSRPVWKSTPPQISK